MARTVALGGPKSARREKGWRLVFKRIQEAAQLVEKGESPKDVAARFSKPVDPDDVRQWGVDWKMLGKTGFQAKYGGANAISRSTGSKPALSMKDMAVAARNEAHRLEVAERQVEQQLERVRAELRDVRELLSFLDRKQQGGEEA
jgi:hypothetical protein